MLPTMFFLTLVSLHHAQLIDTTPFTHTWDNIQAGFFTDFGANTMLDQVTVCVAECVTVRVTVCL